MEKIKNAKQESGAQSDPTMYKLMVKKGNNAVDFGEVCPYCGNKDTVMLDDALDKETNILTEAWACYSHQCEGFSRELFRPLTSRIL